MRFLGRLLAVAATSTLCICSMNGWNHAEAACVTGATTPSGTPESDALTMFVTTITVSNGDPRGQVLPDFGVAPAATGLLAADQICTLYAADSSFAKASYNRNAAGGTVQFMALLSTVGVNAIDRFSSVSTKNIQNAKGTCLGANILDLFSGSSGGGYDLGAVADVSSTDGFTILTESAENPSQNQQVWTGTGKFVSGSPSTSTADKYGGTFHAAGQTGTFSQTAFQCNNWEATSGGGIIGILNPTVGGSQNFWLQQSEVGTDCSNGYSLYCISAQPFQGPTQPPGGSADPQFVGLQGQQFQVHGMPEEFFNLITTPTFQMNSRFTYLASGQCNYNNTECWTHPGTYVDQIGFMFPGIQIKAVAGSHRKGARVWVNSEEMKKSSGKVVMTTTTTTTTTTSNNNSSVVGEISVSHPHHDVLIVSSPLFTIEVTNSDWFFNFNLMFHQPEILSAGRLMHYIGDSRTDSTYSEKFYPNYPMHGLVGQTWKNARYPAKRMYQGEVDDYMLLDHTLFSTQFMFNLYAY